MPPNIHNLVDQYAQKYGVPVPLARAVVAQESGFDPNARSQVGALGVMQLMPGTAKGLGVKNPLDPVQNIDGGMRMLSNLLHQFKDPKLALAAYNAGPAAVQKYGGIPPYAETQHYVQTIMAAAHLNAQGDQGAAWGGGPSDTGKPLPPGSPAPDGLAGMSPSADVNFSAPSDTSVSILQKLGGTSGRVAQGAQESIPMPLAQAVAPGAGNKSTNADPYDPGPMIPHGAGLNGEIPMHLGGKNPYTNLHFAGHVDFQHVNPRLLDAINREAKKRGVVATVISGYRSNQYSAKNGGFQGDPHTKGLATDVYINGHPIGEVIGPEEWAKYGIRSGNTPGFYKGKPDPEHLDLIGVPVKTKGPKA